MEIKPYNNIPSIRRIAAIVGGKDPALVIGDTVYVKDGYGQHGIVRLIHANIKIEETIVIVEMFDAIMWNVPIKIIYWLPLLKRWECACKEMIHR